MIAFLRPSGLLQAVALALWLVLDHAYPEHRGIWLKIHPVHTCFIMAKKLGKSYSTKAYGVCTWIACVFVHIAPYLTLLYLSWIANPVLWILASCYILKVSISLRLLLDIVGSASDAAKRGDWDRARCETQLIVRRNVYELDEPRVLSAAIESLAENFVDGFLSPLFYYLLLGPIGALVQRLANTMDGALGYKTPELRDVGWFSAFMDTVLNFIPARLGALTIVFVGGLRHGRLREAWRTWRRFARATPSKNAGHPMAAMAGVLGVRLEKPGCYVLGLGEEPSPQHVDQALEVVKLASALWIAIAMIVFLAPYVAHEVLP